MVDTTDPVFSSIVATMASATVTATFSEPIACATVISGDFIATVGGTPTGVTAAGCTGGSDATIDLTLASAPFGGATVAVSMTGTVQDVAGNTAATVTRNTTAASDVTVTVNQAAGQADPTNTSPITFAVVFSEAVNNFIAADVSFTGSSAGGTLAATLSGGPSIYTVEVTGMTSSGTVVVDIAAAAATDVDGNLSAASTSTDNTVTWDVVAPTVTVIQAAGQADPTNTSPIDVTVTFSEPVTGFSAVDVSLAGSTAGGTLAATVSGGPTTYNVAVSGMTTSGTVVVTIGAGAADDAAGNANAGSTSTDNSVTWDVTAPTVTMNQAAGQADPTNNTSPINFTATFSEVVTGFTGSDVSLAGSTAGGTLAATVTGGPTVYNVAVSGMTTDGTVTVSLAAGGATDAAGNTSSASTASDNSVTRDTTAPTVTVDQASGQADPDSSSPIDFTVVFGEPVTGFTGTDVSFAGGTAGGTLAATVTGGPTTYNLAVTGMTTPGTVVASVGPGVATDPAGNGNQASTSTDNSVTWDAQAPSVTVNQASGQADPTNTSPIDFTITFSEPVTGLSSGDVSFAGSTSGGTLAATVTAGPTSYNVAVSGMTTPSTVVVSLAAGAATDAAGNTSAASTSTDNTVTYDNASPVFVRIETAVGSATVVAVFDEPVLCSSAATGDFLAAVSGMPVAVSAVACAGTSDSTVGVTLASALPEGATTALTLNAGAVTDPATNASGGVSTHAASSIALNPGSTPNVATVGCSTP